MDWSHEKKLACMILARTLDRMEMDDSSPRAVQDLYNIIAYLKESTALLKGKKLNASGQLEHTHQDVFCLPADE
jgi:hypothetical protein